MPWTLVDLAGEPGNVALLDMSSEESMKDLLRVLVIVAVEESSGKAGF